MAGSREESPDWVRTFQVPAHSALTISSDSESHGSYVAINSNENEFESRKLAKGSPSYGDDNHEAILGGKGENLDKNSHDISGQGKKKANGQKSRETFIVDDEGQEQDIEEETSTDQLDSKRSASDLSSDFDYCPDTDLKRIKKMPDSNVRETEGFHNSLHDNKSCGRSSKPSLKNDLIQMRGTFDVHLDEKKENVIDAATTKDHTDDINDKPSTGRVSTRLPLVLSAKVHRSKALVECEGDSIDLSGDMGAVGRVVISDTASGGSEMKLDLKGTIYSTSIIPCRTFCVVSFGPSEAKIDAIMNDFIKLKPESNVYDAETMVEGTLEGFSFESDDEADKALKMPSHQTEHDHNKEEKSNKPRGRAGKSSGPAQKKKLSGGAKSKLPRKSKKKSQISKKSKAKK